jgi:hypothetical protein
MISFELFFREQSQFVFLIDFYKIPQLIQMIVTSLMLEHKKNIDHVFQCTKFTVNKIFNFPSGNKNLFYSYIKLKTFFFDSHQHYFVNTMVYMNCIKFL